MTSYEEGPQTDPDGWLIQDPKDPLVLKGWGNAGNWAYVLYTFAPRRTHEGKWEWHELPGFIRTENPSRAAAHIGLEDMGDARADEYHGSEFRGKELTPAQRVLVGIDPPPEIDWRPNEMLPEDYYSMSRYQDEGQVPDPSWPLVNISGFLSPQDPNNPAVRRVWSGDWRAGYVGRTLVPRRLWDDGWDGKAGPQDPNARWEWDDIGLTNLMSRNQLAEHMGWDPNSEEMDHQLSRDRHHPEHEAQHWGRALTDAEKILLGILPPPEPLDWRPQEMLPEDFNAMSRYSLQNPQPGEWHPDDNFYRRVWNITPLGDSWLGTFYPRFAGGDWRWVLRSSSPLTPDTIQSMIGVYPDEKDPEAMEHHWDTHANRVLSPAERELGGIDAPREQPDWRPTETVPEDWYAMSRYSRSDPRVIARKRSDARHYLMRVAEGIRDQSMDPMDQRNSLAMAAARMSDAYSGEGNPSAEEAMESLLADLYGTHMSPPKIPDEHLVHVLWALSNGEHGEAPPPAEVDWRPNETVPEDFFAASQYATRPTTKAFLPPDPEEVYTNIHSPLTPLAELFPNSPNIEDLKKFSDPEVSPSFQDSAGVPNSTANLLINMATKHGDDIVRSLAGSAVQYPTQENGVGVWDADQHKFVHKDQPYLLALQQRLLETDPRFAMTVNFHGLHDYLKDEEEKSEANQTYDFYTPGIRHRMSDEVALRPPDMPSAGEVDWRPMETVPEDFYTMSQYAGGSHHSKPWTENLPSGAFHRRVIARGGHDLGGYWVHGLVPFPRRDGSGAVWGLVEGQPLQFQDSYDAEQSVGEGPIWGREEYHDFRPSTWGDDFKNHFMRELTPGELWLAGLGPGPEGYGEGFDWRPNEILPEDYSRVSYAAGDPIRVPREHWNRPPWAGDTGFDIEIGEQGLSHIQPSYWRVTHPTWPYVFHVTGEETKTGAPEWVADVYRRRPEDEEDIWESDEVNGRTLGSVGGGGDFQTPEALLNHLPKVVWALSDSQHGVAPTPSEIDWRPNEILPEDYYSMSRYADDELSEEENPYVSGVGDNKYINDFWHTKSEGFASGFKPGTKFVNAWAPIKHKGQWVWNYAGMSPYLPSRHGPYEELPETTEITHHEPLKPHHLWGYNLPGGVAPTAPEIDWRPNEMLPDDFDAMSRYASNQLWTKSRSRFGFGGDHVTSYVPLIGEDGKYYWSLQTYPEKHNEEIHGAWDSLPDSKDVGGKYLSPQQLWALDLPGGEAPTAPEIDWRPAETVPEDFNALSRYADGPSEDQYILPTWEGAHDEYGNETGYILSHSVPRKVNGVWQWMWDGKEPVEVPHDHWGMDSREELAKHLGIPEDHKNFDEEARKYHDYEAALELTPTEVWLVTGGREGRDPFEIDWRPQEMLPEDFDAMSRYQGPEFDHPERLQFEQHLRDNPHDADAHGIFADWLDEHNESQKADFHRSQEAIIRAGLTGGHAEETTDRIPEMLPEDYYSMSRYEASEADANELLRQLSLPEQAEHRWGHDEPTMGLRGITADALEEQGRTAEANVLREPGRHVMIRDGQVIPARHGVGYIQNAMQQADQVLDDDGMIDPMYGTGYADHLRFTRHQRDPEKFHVAEIDPTGHVLRGRYHRADKIPTVAWRYYLDQLGRAREALEMYDEEDVPENVLTAIDNIRMAPHEEPDPDHPMNRPPEIPAPDEYQGVQYSATHYAGFTTEDDFQQALDEDPYNHQLRMIFADWLQESNDPRAEGYRALGRLGKVPLLGSAGNPTRSIGSWTNNRNDIMPLVHCLPDEWWSRLSGSYSRSRYWHDYENGRREAEDAAASIYPSFPDDIKERIMAAAKYVRDEVPQNYAGFTTEEDFQNALDEHPDDHQTRMIFADWLDEQGDPRAMGYRILGQLGKYPRPYAVGGASQHHVEHTLGQQFVPGFWTWWTGGNSATYDELPLAWTDVIDSNREATRVRHGNNSDEPIHRSPTHISRREADDAAALGFGRMTPEQQQEIAGQATESGTHYSASPQDVYNLLEQMRAKSTLQRPDAAHRLITADALDEVGRSPEAQLLRSDQPIYFWHGKVHLARGRQEKQFRRGYEQAAMWTGIDHDSGQSFNALDIGPEHLHPQTRREMAEDAAHFYHSHYDMIPGGGHNVERAGHDFWLSRNGHGAGFFDDPGLYGEHADDLQKAARATGEYHLDADADPDAGPHDDQGWQVFGYNEGNDKWGQPAGLVQGTHYGAGSTPPPGWGPPEEEPEDNPEIVFNFGEEEPQEPEEDDYVSEDGVRWYQNRRHVLTVPDGEDHGPYLRAHAEANRFWPNAWIISDHGNAHLTHYDATEPTTNYADERAAFEAAIDANPLESSTRLVYADLLDELGEHDEADFQRSMGDWMYGRNENTSPYQPEAAERITRDDQGRVRPWRVNVFGGAWNDEPDVPRGVAVGHIPTEWSVADHGPVNPTTGLPHIPDDDIDNWGARLWPDNAMYWPHYRGMEEAFRRAFMRGRQNQPTQASRYERRNCPPGGVKYKEKEYRSGQFIPGAVMFLHTPARAEYDVRVRPEEPVDYGDGDRPDWLHEGFDVEEPIQGMYRISHRQLPGHFAEVFQHSGRNRWASLMPDPDEYKEMLEAIDRGERVGGVNLFRQDHNSPHEAMDRISKVWGALSGGKTSPAPDFGVDWRPNEMLPEDFDAMSRYEASEEDVNNLLTQLAQPEQNEHRWGYDDPTGGLRGITADALDEQGRNQEAAVLREPGRHVVVHEGRVIPARFTDAHILHAVRDLNEHLLNHGSQAMEGWGTTLFGDTDYTNPNDHEDYEPLGPDEHRFWEGEYDNFRHWKRHISEAGPEVASMVDDLVEGLGEWEDQELEPERWVEYDQLLNDVRNAPYEEPDPDHPMNRPAVPEPPIDPDTTNEHGNPIQSARYDRTDYMEHSEDEFHALLDENPHDHTQRQILADFLDEQGDPRAAGYRAMGRLGVTPRAYNTEGYSVEHYGGVPHHWTIWTTSGNDEPEGDIIPSDWHELIHNDIAPAYEGQRLFHNSRPTRREMDDEIASAFGRLPPERQASLLSLADKRQGPTGYADVGDPDFAHPTDPSVPPDLLDQNNMLVSDHPASEIRTFNPYGMYSFRPAFASQEDGGPPRWTWEIGAYHGLVNPFDYPAILAEWLDVDPNHPDRDDQMASMENRNIGINEGDRVTPQQLWLLTGGRIGEAPHGFDWRPNETVPEDFYASSRYADETDELPREPSFPGSDWSDWQSPAQPKGAFGGRQHMTKPPTKPLSEVPSYPGADWDDRSAGTGEYYPNTQSPDDLPPPEYPQQPVDPEHQQRVDWKSHLGTSPVWREAEMGPGGVNQKKLLTLDDHDGTRVVFKPGGGERNSGRAIRPGSYYQREVATSEVADALGMHDLVPPTVFKWHVGDHGSAQHYVPMAQDAHGLASHVKYDGPEDLGRAALLDYITGNTDRHDGNWMMKDGKMFLIDHGLNFPTRNSPTDENDVANKNLHNAELLFEAVDRRLPLPDLTHISGKWPQIQQALEQSGIEPEAIQATKERYDAAVSGQFHHFHELPDYVWKSGSMQSAVEIQRERERQRIAEARREAARLRAARGH